MIDDKENGSLFSDFRDPPKKEKNNENITTESDIKIPDFLKEDEDGYDMNDTVNSSFNNCETESDSHKETFNSKDSFDTNNIDTKNSFESKASFDSNTSSNSNASFESNTSYGKYSSDFKTENQTEKTESTNFESNTFEKEKEKKFTSKISADSADKKLMGGKPRVLNKKFLLASIICVVGGIFLITFLMPGKKKQTSKNQKPVAELPHSTDYSSIATRHLQEDYEIPVNNTYGTKSYGLPTETSKSTEVEIPPVIPEKKLAYSEPNTKSSYGNNAPALDIPDTRNDSLHGKQISGIKGLSSTQMSYSTDYQQTIAKNTASTKVAPSNSLPSKEEYMNNVLSAYSQAYGNATGGNSYSMQNDQSGKNSFFNSGRQSDMVGRGEFLNLNTLWQGTIFEAVLTSELNTDLPGEITARIAKNIYSSQDGRYLLIPQNSVVYGTYNSSISYAQSRVQVAWHTLIRPDGYQIQLGSMNGTDAKGASGLKGFVNDHPMAYLKAVGLMSVFSIINEEFSSQMGATQNQYVQNIMANSQAVANELADKLIDRAMNVQPTLKIKSGTKVNIVVNQNLTLPPCADIPVTEAYHRQR